MMARFAALVAGFLAAGPTLAQNMNTEEARRFVTGKLFAFRCVDGSGGSGRIYADGSVIGKIQSKATSSALRSKVCPLSRASISLAPASGASVAL